MQFFPIQKNILLGFAKEIKSLAVPEVRPNSTFCLVELYKGFPKGVNIYLPKSNQRRDYSGPGHILMSFASLIKIGHRSIRPIMCLKNSLDLSNQAL